MKSLIKITTILYSLSTLFCMAMETSKPIINETNIPSKADYISKFLKNYKKDILEFSHMIFVQGDRGETYNRPEVDLKKELIYNQQGYDDGIENLPPEGTSPKGNVANFGNPLRLDENTPIGYNVIMPMGRQVKAVVVRVYGGLTKRDRTSKMFRPGNTSDLEDYLLRQGIAIIQLNLVDLREGKIHQSLMPEELHTRIHNSINKFYDTLKHHPESLHVDLAPLQDKKICLFGESFGGRTSIRHAELYKNSFDCYISHDGGLSFEMIKASQLNLGIQAPTTEKARATSEYWSPMTDDPNGDEKIEQIVKPILLLHNLDDNRVNVKVTLHWYDKAIKVGKKDLVQLYITKIGNAIEGQRGDAGEKGHGVPEEKEAFENYAETVTSFILNGISKLTTASQWLAHKTQILSNKNYSSATVEDQFLSEAYQLYKEVLNNRESKSTNITAADITNEKMDGEQKEKVWQKFYVPILHIIAYIDDIKDDEEKLTAEMDYLKNSKMLTGPVLSGGLKQELPLHLEYMKEKHSLQIPSEMTIDFLANNASVQAQYRKFLTTPSEIEAGWGIDKKAATYLLTTLYKGNVDQIYSGLINPELFKPEIEKWRGRLDDLKAKLIMKINEGKKNIQTVWKNAGQELLKNRS